VFLYKKQKNINPGKFHTAQESYILIFRGLQMKGRDLTTFLS